MADDAQVCNCNGVSKGDLVACVRGGEHSVSGVHGRDPRRQGLRLVQAAGQRDRRVGRRAATVAEDPARVLVRARRSRWTSPTLMAAIREQDLRVGVRGASPRWRPAARRTRGRRWRSTSLLQDDLGRRVRRREATREFINDRVHANIQRDGTFSVVPQIKGGVTTAGAAAADRRRRREVRGPDGQDHRRPADRPARRPQGGPAGDVGGPRHAVRATPTARACAR